LAPDRTHNRSQLLRALAHVGVRQVRQQLSTLILDVGLVDHRDVVELLLSIRLLEIRHGGERQRMQIPEEKREVRGRRGPNIKDRDES
jgi:hypothetical protein